MKGAITFPLASDAVPLAPEMIGFFNNSGIIPGFDSSPSSLQRFYLSEVHSRISAYNSSRTYVDGVLETNTKKVMLEERKAKLPWHVRDSGVQNLDYPLVDEHGRPYRNKGEPFLSVSCIIGDKPYTWLPLNMTLNRKVKQALLDAD